MTSNNTEKPYIPEFLSLTVPPSEKKEVYSLMYGLKRMKRLK